MGRRLGREYLFGISPCLAAFLAKRRELYSLLLCESLKKTELLRPEIQQIISEAEQTHGCKIKYKSAALMDRLTGNRPHQKVILESKGVVYKSKDELIKHTNSLLSKKKGSEQRPLFYLALDQVQDPMNLGAVLRSALYFGVDAVVATSDFCCKLSPVVSKASSGAMEWLSVYDVGNLPEYLKKQHENAGWNVIGSASLSKHEKETKDVSVITVGKNAPLKRNTMLVIGNEGFGMRPAVEEQCNHLVTILPRKKLLPGMESLNLSVACGILLHAFLSPNEVHPK